MFVTYWLYTATLQQQLLIGILYCVGHDIEPLYMVFLLVKKKCTHICSLLHFQFYHTCSDKSPAVGVVSSGSDSGIGSSEFKCIPGQPTQTPLERITTGATAVTKPPALYLRN
jgi:hypothetical protein